MGTDTPYMSEMVDEFLLEESVAMTNETISIQSIRDKYSEEVKLLSLSDHHILISQRKRMDHQMNTSSSFYTIRYPSIMRLANIIWKMIIQMLFLI